MASPLHKLLVSLVSNFCSVGGGSPKLPDAPLGVLLEKCGSTNFLFVLKTTIVLIIWSLPKKHSRQAIILWIQTTTWDVSSSVKCKSCLGNKVACWHRLDAFWSSLQLLANGTATVNLSLLVCQKSNSKVKLNGQTEDVGYRKKEMNFRIGERGSRQPVLETCVTMLFMCYFSSWMRGCRRMCCHWKRHLLARESQAVFVFPR